MSTSEGLEMGGTRRRVRPTFFLAFGLAFAACASDRGTIGAVLAQRSDRTLLVREAPADLAAARAGVREGDEVLLIDGRDVRSMSPAEVHRTLSGDIGDPVKLTLIRGNDVVRLTLLRTRARAEPARPPIAKNP